MNNRTNEMKNKVKSIVIVITVTAMMLAMIPVNSVAFAASTTNSTMVSKLPTSGVSLSMPLQTGLVTSLDAKGKVTGYQFYTDVDYVNAKAGTKDEMKKKVIELTAGKSSNYKKAKAIQEFVRDHMTYYGHFISVIGAWEDGVGNCETYASLTSALMYLAGIPNAYAITNGHIFNLVLCEGRWIPCDSQTYFDGDLDLDYRQIETIVFRNGKQSYVVDDLSGLKLADVGEYHAVVDKTVAKSGITIPSYVTGYYKDWMCYYPQITIRGTKSTAGEKLVKTSGYKCIRYSGNQFTANPSHATVKITTKAATYFAKGKATHRCKNCGKVTASKIIAKKKLAKPRVSYKGSKKKMTVKYTAVKGATGFQVAYKVAGAKKFTVKKYNTRKSTVKTISKLKRGKKYTVKIRAYVKSGSKYAYSAWTPTRSVRVK